MATVSGMTIPQQQPRLSVRNLDDLVSVVPYLIGFHPEESLVVLILTDGRVELTARVDLEAVAAPSALADFWDRLDTRFPRSEPWFVTFSQDRDLSWAVLGRCAELAGDVRLGRVVAVLGDHWEADHPDGPSGRSGASPRAAEAALMGLPARSSRHELALLILGPDEAAAARLVDRVASLAEVLDGRGSRAKAAILNRLVSRAGPLGEDDAVMAAILVSDPARQLSVLRRLNTRNADAQVEMWVSVLNRALGPYRSGPLGLLGMAAWLGGNGALMTICLEELDVIDPLAPLPGLLDWLNLRVVPPDSWQRHRQGLLRALADHLASARPRVG
jgi:hypothetical protein